MRTTDDQIEIDVRDDSTALARIFTLPVPARLEALAEMNGVSSFEGGSMDRLRQIHEHGDGFRVNVDDPRYAEALARLVGADAWGRIRPELGRAWEYQRSVLPGIRHPEKIEVTLTLGNTDDPVFVEHTLGYYGMGSTPGTIWSGWCTRGSPRSSPWRCAVPIRPGAGTPGSRVTPSTPPTTR